jgi:hypothetical protein
MLRAVIGAAAAVGWASCNACLLVQVEQLGASERLLAVLAQLGARVGRQVLLALELAAAAPAPKVADVKVRLRNAREREKRKKKRRKRKREKKGKKGERERK